MKLIKAITHPIDHLINKLTFNPKLTLLGLFFCLSIGIILNSYLHPYGYLTPDSNNYLRLAKSIAQGNGLYVLTPDFESSDQPKFFATWPIGYPALVAIFHLITGIKIFWASKILNILIAGVMLWLMWRVFGNKAWLYGSLLATASFIELFSYTFSEIPFMLSLFGFPLILYHYFSPDFHNSSRNAISLGFLILTLFIFRYIGAFSLIVAGIYFLWYWYHHKKLDWQLLMVLFSTSALMGLYLWNNYLETGAITGYARPEALQSRFEQVYQLVRSVLYELCFPLTKKFAWLSLVITGIVSQILLFLLFNKPKVQFNLKRSELNAWPYFLVSGFVYLVCLVVLRLNFIFDDFNFRLLAPATLLLGIGGINLIHCRYPQAFTALSRLMLVLMVASLLINIPVKHLYNHWFESNQPTYPRSMAKVKSIYDSIKRPAVIGFGDGRYIFQKPKIYTPHPYGSPKASEAQPMDTFLQKIRHFDGPVYLDIPDTTYIHGYREKHPTVNQFIRENQSRGFIQIK